MTATEVLFFLFSAAICGGALGVVFSQNVARMAFWLIVSLGSTSGLFFLLRADFVGATQLLIYVGGTVVLLIFGVMLTASGPYQRIRTAPGELAMGWGVGVLLLSMIYSTVCAADWSKLATKPGTAAVRGGAGYNPADEGNTARPIGMKLIGASLEDLGNTRGRLSTGYLLPFEIISIHLLVVLIGAAYLARAKRRVTASDRGEPERAMAGITAPGPNGSGLMGSGLNQSAEPLQLSGH
jgi:NADH-quinone oxidoreductase subunit J